MVKVVLDPGHGGKTKVGGSSPNNALGPSGTLEKNVTLKVAFAAKSAFEQSGIEVILTRDKDVNVGLAARAAVAKQAKAQVFVSIHFNGFNNSAQGTETWVAPNATKASRALAGFVQPTLCAATGLKDRGIKNQPALAVIKPSVHAASTAAILVEISFMDVAAEEQRLADSDYITRLGNAISSGAVAYLESIGAISEGLEVAEEELEDGRAAILLGAAVETEATMEEAVGEDEALAGIGFGRLGLEEPDAESWRAVRDALATLSRRIDQLAGGATEALHGAGELEALEQVDAAPRYQFLAGRLTKQQFLARNKAELHRLIDDVNGVLSAHYGHGARPLTFLDAAVLINCEAGLKGSFVDPDFEHSLGERGLLPLPSNLKFWNAFAGPTPAPNARMPLDANIWHFMLYLGQLRNKLVAKISGRTLFRDLFNHSGLAGVQQREARLLAGIVHGYFSKATYKSGGVPFEHILNGYATDVPLPDMMRPTRYTHAGKQLMVGRHNNIEEAISFTTEGAG